MARGYTCCIDYDKLVVSANKLESIDDYLSNKDFSTIFTDIEDELKNVNFEHNNCLSYKDNISDILSRILDIRKNVSELSLSLKNTISNFNETEEYDSNGIRKLSDYYDNTTARDLIHDSLKGNTNIKVAYSTKILEGNIDESIKEYVSNNSLTDYPSEYNSLGEWYEKLYNKYDKYHIEEYEKQDFIDRDMAIWRQEQTGSKVTSVATSDYAEYQFTIDNDISYRKNNTTETITYNITNVTSVLA